MKKDDLESLQDPELQQLIKDAQGLLAAREKQRKQKAIDDAKAALAAVGLTFRDVVAAPGTGEKKRGRPPGSKTKTPAPAKTDASRRSEGAKAETKP